MWRGSAEVLENQLNCEKDLPFRRVHVCSNEGFVNCKLGLACNESTIADFLFVCFTKE